MPGKKTTGSVTDTQEAGRGRLSDLEVVIQGTERLRDDCWGQGGSGHQVRALQRWSDYVGHSGGTFQQGREQIEIKREDQAGCVNLGDNRMWMRYLIQSVDKHSQHFFAKPCARDTLVSKTDLLPSLLGFILQYNLEIISPKNVIEKRPEHCEGAGEGSVSS